MMKKITVISILILCMAAQVRAQDFQFSQFYAAPLYLSPAFAGSTDLSRVGVNYRKQWPGLGYDFNSYSAYIDHYILDYNSGVGFAINSFEETHMKLKFTDVSLHYAYKLALDDYSSLRFGGQLSYVMRNAALDHLVFGDQINLFDRTVNTTSLDAMALQEPVNYLDYAFGALFMNHRFWLGTSAHHVSRPSYTFFMDDNDNRLPVKWSVHGGYMIDVNARDFRNGIPDNYIILSANYKEQGPFKQIDLNVQQQYGIFVGGLGYRGLVSSEELPYQATLVGLMGVTLESGLSIGYSYDYMLSAFGRSTAGAHEISVRYAWLAGDPRKRNQRRTILSCPF
ncbi:PorP/SprF family type IX secretion system membrane protein [Lunatimonas salinarum]|uniref:PorP/SprF family type IX secretion system membrane protein n=1 Tax=Lunatimonas salinarum TaxID=1774590 RepID=UPI001ADEF692|nr:type IX secretion system membrane protein PorP/SprF [Lunatimonas salinarum]